MLIKLGVDISRLKRPARRALKIVETVYLKNNLDEPVITSTYEGNHRPDSLHYCHLAIDFRIPKNMPIGFIDELERFLGKDYDVVLSKNCIHIEYDPKK